MDRLRVASLQYFIRPIQTIGQFCDQVSALVDKDGTFREDIELSNELIRVRVAAVLPGGFSGERRSRLQDVIRARTGRPVQLSVLDVATRDELRPLTPSAAPRVETLEDLRARLVGALGTAVRTAWPSDVAPLLDYTIGLKADSAALDVRVTYISKHELGDVGQAVLQKAIRDRTGSNDVVISFEWVPEEWTMRFTGRSDLLSPADKQDLDEVSKVLKRFPLVRCIITGGTSRDRAVSSLEERRIAQMRSYLNESGGIPEARIDSKPAAEPPSSLAVRLATTVTN